MKKMKLQTGLLILVVLCSLKLIAGEVDTSSYITRVLTIVNQNIGKDPIQLTTTSLKVNEFTRTLEGKARYWGIDDIEYIAIFNSVYSLISLSLLMPSH